MFQLKLTRIVSGSSVFFFNYAQCMFVCVSVNFYSLFSSKLTLPQQKHGKGKQGFR